MNKFADEVAAAASTGKFADFAPGEYVDGTLAALIERFIVESRQPGARKLGDSYGYTLRRLQRAPIAAKQHTALKPLDFIDHCKARRASGVLPQTILQDMTALCGVLRHAAEVWEMPDTGLAAYRKAKPLLMRQQLIAKAQSRDRRPSADEIERLLAHFDEQAKDPRTKVPMRTIVEFSLVSARRISETCRLRWGDVDAEKRLCLVRDLKNPKGKGFNDSFPLLGRAWDLVMAQPRRDPNDPDERIFPYNAKTCIARYVLAKKKLGIKGLRLHDSRREAISRMFEQGYNVPEVAKLSLHRNPSLLLKTYTSLRPEDLHLGPAAKR